ncbi:MAG: hypothetical protein CM15mP68_7630 [Pseudomonadota bacterium]|nr:MAG: hypothetical protein CM15mP68_7630 [Pseudomonadota bacterium]
MDLLVEGGRVIGCKTQMELDFYASSVVLTTGTFLAVKSILDTNSNLAAEQAMRPLTPWQNVCARCRFRVGRLKTERHRALMAARWIFKA